MILSTIAPILIFPCLLVLFLIIVIPLQYIGVFFYKTEITKIKTVFLTIILLLILSSLEVIYYSYSSESEHRSYMLSRTNVDIKTIAISLELFRAENYSYPTTSEGLDSLINNPNPEKYKYWRKFLKAYPTDPWGNDYQYKNPGLHEEIDIYSLGSDGIKSEDDIGNWDLNN